MIIKISETLVKRAHIYPEEKTTDPTQCKNQQEWHTHTQP